jgi:MYXO-CTERM domain-containing protein
MGTLDAAISASNNLIVDYDPGVANLAGVQPQDFDLIAGSEAIDQGLTVAGHTLDFLNRVVPDPGGVTDIGAFEYGSTQGEEQPDLGMGGTTGSGGADTGVGGADTGVGGADTGVGGADTGTGGAASGVGGADTGIGGTPETGVGGSSTGVGGAPPGSGGADATLPTQPPIIANSEADSAEEESGCACTVVGAHGPGRPAHPELALLGAVLVVWRRRRIGRSSRNR